MIAKELIELLLSGNPDAEVILQKDGEGNGYSPLSCVDFNTIYIPESTWSGEVYSTYWSAGDACMDDKEWEAIKAKPRCVVLCPVN